MMEHAQQDIAYTAFKSPTYIKDTTFENIYFQYNAMQQRSAMHYGNLSENSKESKFHKIYSADGSMEVIFNSETHDTQFTTYIAGDAYSSTIISRANFSEKDGFDKDYFYLHRDHLGSILAITNSNGETVEKRHFDAWGSLTKYENINGITTVPEFAGGLFLDRGYTGHEHLLGVGLIHMNGRLYDPQLHRFLQPDNFVQDPYNTQNYNRYGYVLNNPLKYTDPSGEFIHLVAAVMIGVGVGLATYTLTALLADVPFTVQGLIQTAIVSAFTSAVTFGIGQATAGVANFYTRAAYQALAHGTFNGAMAEAQGGSFINGFAAGSLSSIAASAWSGGPTNDKTYEFGGGASKTFTNRSVAGLGGSFGGSTAGMIAFGTIAGGAGAALTGGNFWQGAVTGLVVSELNHAMHSDDNGYDENGKEINKNGGDFTDYKYDSNGNVIESTAVIFKDLSQGEFQARGGFRTYGINGHRMPTGAISEDNTIANYFIGGAAAKGIGAGIGAGLNYIAKTANALKIHNFRVLGAFIGEFHPGLNTGVGWRLGISKANTLPGYKGTQMVFRLTKGNDVNHIFNIVIGKWGK